MDAGAGEYCRYEGLVKYDKRISVDLDKEKNPDYVADLVKLPLDDNFIDSILCTQVLGDVKDPLVVLKEFARVLKPGGCLLLTEALINELHDEPNDYWRFTLYSMRYLMGQAGFVVENIDRRGGFFASRAQNNIRYLINKYDLYNKKHIAWLRLLIKIYGRWSIWRDKRDRSDVGKSFPIGWAVFAKKVFKNK